MERVDGLSDQAISVLLTGTRRIALVGASNKPERPSWGVARFLVDQGYDVVPINPGLSGQMLHGRQVAALLGEAGPLDMVDVFRRPEEIESVIDEAIRHGARSIWLQLGLVHETAAARARAAGLVVVMDRCPAIEIPRLGLHPRPT